MNVYRVIQHFPEYSDRRIVAKNEEDAKKYALSLNPHGVISEFSLHVENVEITTFKRKKTSHKERLEAVNGLQED